MQERYGFPETFKNVIEVAIAADFIDQFEFALIFNEKGGLLFRTVSEIVEVAFANRHSFPEDYRKLCSAADAFSKDQRLAFRDIDLKS